MGDHEFSKSSSGYKGVRRRYSSVPSKREESRIKSNNSKVTSTSSYVLIDQPIHIEDNEDERKQSRKHHKVESRNNSIGYNHDSQIIKLNVGGRIFMTSKETLIGNNDNFFFPLVNGDFKATKDENGAYFIDRNGDYFAPILDFLRHGKLIIPDNMNIEAVFEEAKFYSIDLTPGICGDIKEGLYTSTNWILFIERDDDNPWIFGITGVEEKTKYVFFQETCRAKDGAIHWRNYVLFSKNGKVYIKDNNSFKNKAQLFYRCPKSQKFPLPLFDTLISDKKFGGERIFLTFNVKSNDIHCKSTHITSTVKYKSVSKANVLCKSLIIMRMEDDTNWLLYLYSDLAFFTFNHPYMEFGNSFHLHVVGKSNSLQRIRRE